MKRRAPAVALISVFTAMFASTAAFAQFGDIGSIIKIFGIGYAVKVFGGQINSFLNTVLQQHKVGGLEATKVVPLIRVGAGTYVGAVQLAGRPDLVSSAQAAAEGELNFADNHVQLRYLIPVNSLNVLKGIPKRVSGVGVSAIIDFHV